MAVSLEWLLAQREFDLRLVAGQASGEQLSWAHAIDAVDPTPWLTGGELILTTGLRLSPAAGEQRAYVERLADAGIAALGFGVGVRFDEIPEPILTACAERSLPLIEVPLATPFIAITQTVARRFAERQVEDVQRALTYQRNITRSAVRGGLGAAVVLLARELGCDAVVLDEYGVVMAASTRRSELLDRINQEYRRLSSAARPGTVGIMTEQGTLEMQMLQGRSGVCGWLAVRHPTPLSPTDRLLLNQAAGLITLQLDWPAELIEAYHALGGTLLALLLDSDTAPGLDRHLHHFGFEARDSVVLAVATSARRHARLLDVVSAHLESTKRPHVVSRVDAGVAMMLLERDAARLVESLEVAVDEAGVTGVVIGLSGTLAQADVSSGLQPAELAAAAARRERRRVGWFNELTLGAVLADETVRTRVWGLAAPSIEALTADTSPRGTELLASLEAFLHHNGSFESAARALEVHRHTLRTRIDRVEELTGLSLDVAENRVLLLLALLSRPARSNRTGKSGRGTAGRARASR
jgi:purine catabolism regulator